MPAKSIAYVLVAVAVLALAASASRQQFEEFQARFGKHYASAEEEAKRFAIFEQNMKIAAKHQAANPHATFGVNEFSDVSAAEFKVRHNLDSKMKPSLESLPSVTMPTETTVEKIDWRTKGAVVAIKNQGQCGSCWSFGTVAGIEGQWFLAGNTLTSLSEQEFVSCDTVDDGCNGGYPSHAMKWDIENRGGELVTEASYPYVSGNGEVPACSWKGTKFGAKIDGYKKLPKNEKQMAAYCGANGPITILVDASSFQTYTGGILTNCIGVQIDHCVAIVGFDLTNSPPYWIVRNSWGVSWGEQGYIRVEYGTDQCLITDGPIIGQVKGGPSPGPTPPPVPTPSPPPTPPTPPPAGSLFKVGGAGPGETPPSGYELAAVSDLQSEAFISQVNNGNLMDGGETVTGCCCFAVKSGFLVYESSPVSYMGPYTTGGQYDCAEVLTNPVKIGSSGDGGLPFPDFLGPLTNKTVSKFSVRPNFDPLQATGCTPGTSTWGIYIKKGHHNPTPAPGPTNPPPPPPPPSGLHFEVYGAGSGFNTPKGYRLASIEDLQTDAFIDQVNKGKLMDQGETVAGCCCLAVKGGYLVSKNSPDTYLGAYDNTGSYDCQEVLTNPVYIGSSVNGGLPFPDWLNPLTKDIVSKFTTKSNFDPLYQSGCTAGQPTWGIYVKGSETPAPHGPIVDPPYIVGGQGKGFKAPEGYELADISHLQSKDFITFYNDYGLTEVANTKVDGCCVFATYDGFLTAGSKNASFVAPYGSNGKIDCHATLTAPILLGTTDNGSMKNQFFDELTAKQAASFAAQDSVVKSVCNSTSTSYAIYMLSDEGKRQFGLGQMTKAKRH